MSQEWPKQVLDGAGKGRESVSVSRQRAGP